MAGTRPFADGAARDRIVTDLDTTLMVEAGAGSGKTTSLVGRMLAHVRRGTTVERIAAVTFTRKAATELRERFETALEQAARDAAESEEARQRFGRARDELDRAFLGTIHAFCGRLLREHPLEAGLDPSFEEIDEADWPQIRQAFWARWLDRARRGGEPLLDELRGVGIDPRRLYQGFESFLLYPDVTFEAPRRPAPDTRACRRSLEQLMRRARELMPRELPDGECKLQRMLRRLEFLRATTDWGHAPSLCDALAILSASGCKVTQKYWSDKRTAKALGADWAAFLDAECAPLLATWRAHRYAPVIALLTQAAAEFERERLATARLSFGDLLINAARLLRENPVVRRQLGERYRWLLVDEFQDTDPVQAEVCFLLASDPAEGDDWRQVIPRPGSLFVVGDPKQSIYRFRRADIGIYELVKERIRGCGDVLELVQNFRSVDAIRTFVNDQFERVFPASATTAQASFVRMVTTRPGSGEDGVFRTRVAPQKKNAPAIVAADAEQVASWIRQRIDLRQAVPGDFLVLTLRKQDIEAYARALAARNVPATLAGAGLPQELELGELLVVLRALADPANPVAVMAALEGMPFGCSHADLWDAREARLDLSIAHRPAETTSPVGRALEQLYQWWIASQRHPPDVLLDRIMDDAGLLAYAASLPLGESRAGTMLHLVERVRMTAARDGGTLAAAISAIEATLAVASTDAPLRPGRGDAVRVMNLHKAKGLEAPIVVLAAPVPLKPHPVKVHVRRTSESGATGGLVVAQDRNILAHPAEWAQMEAAESVLLQAEQDRLRYVAATRARRELVVTQLEFQHKSGPARDTSIWGPFATALTTRPSRTMAVTAPPGRRELVAELDELAGKVHAAREACDGAACSSLVVTTVTRAVKGDVEVARRHDLTPAGELDEAAHPLGAAWGRVMHRAIEAMGRGRDGDSLLRFVHAVARDEQLAETETELDLVAATVMAALERIRSSADWRALGKDGAFEVPVMRVVRRDDGVDQITEGVVDAVAPAPQGWRVLDWKTDSVTAAVWEGRREDYERQVREYASILTALTGRPVDSALVRVAVDAP